MNYAASLIISVYKDAVNLHAILHALQWQTRQDFEIIISEDGRSHEISQLLIEENNYISKLAHLTQDDNGFRKNIALNRAIAHSKAEHLIFIDGDCIPHHDFIRQHLNQVVSGVVCAGRRVELGPKFSRRITENNDYIKKIENPLHYLLLAPTLHADGVKNYEVGLPSRLLHASYAHKSTRIVGCNFSCHKHDIFAINGFNEDYRAPGIGEDTDIEWRLRAQGVSIRNIKFLAPVYHLYHPLRWHPSGDNEAILTASRSANRVFCEQGINAHLKESQHR